VSRLRLSLVAVLAAALALPAAAAATVRVTGVDTTKFPTVRFSVVTSKPASVAPAVRENGEPVVGAEAQNLGRSKSVGVVVDTSRSMQGKALADAARAARGFVEKKPAGDRIAVFSFGRTPVALTRSSSATIDATTVLRNLRVDAKQGTALYDAVVLASHQLASEPLQGRVLIVLTDGKDTSSNASLDDAVKAAHRAGTAVYTIGIEGEDFTPTALQQLATRTGGRYFGASSTSELAKVYGSIASELRRTWRIEYPTAARPGDRIELEATVAGQGIARSSLAIPDGNGAVVPPKPSKLVPNEAYGSGGVIAIGLLAGVLVLLATSAAFAARRGSWVRGRLAAHTGERSAASRKATRQQRLAFLRGLFHATERAFGNLKQWRAIQRLLERGETPLRTVEFVYLVAGVAFLFGLLAAVSGQSPIVILGALVVGGLIPVFVVWRRMRKRLRLFEDQLPDLLITIAASLKAGHSFKQGLQAVVDEGQPPASSEFRRVLTETGLGRPMDDALSEMAERTGSENFEFAITAVTIQRQVGGSLANLFDMVADTVRQRQQFARKIRSLTAMGRMSAYTLVGLPFFLAAAISVLNPGYLSPLFHTSAGHWLIGTGLVMIAIGSAILKKIVSFRG
jgi:tight adherence protein B